MPRRPWVAAPPGHGVGDRAVSAALGEVLHDGLTWTARYAVPAPTAHFVVQQRHQRIMPERAYAIARNRYD